MKNIILKFLTCLLILDSKTYFGVDSQIAYNRKLKATCQVNNNYDA